MKEASTTRKFRRFGIGIIMLLILVSSWYLIDRFSYSKELPFYLTFNSNDTILTIGIIGDSWDADEKLDTILHKDLLKAGLKNIIISSGHPGAKSKLIYKNLFKESNNEYSSKFLIERHPDYCIVIAGVNDALSQIGSHYYACHMTQIIKTLLHYKIKPVIISLPEFGIEETLNDLDVLSKNRNSISAYFNNNGEIDNIRKYRKIFIEKLESENLKDSIILIDFDKVCNNYNICPKLFANSSHLSVEGEEKLCEIIAGEIFKKVNIH